MTSTSAKLAVDEHAQFERIVADQARFDAEQAHFEQAMNEQGTAGQAQEQQAALAEQQTLDEQPADASRPGSSGTSFPICGSCTPPQCA